MKTIKHLASILLAAAMFTMAACTPEDTTPSETNFLSNTKWITEDTYPDMDDNGNPIEVYSAFVFLFETNNSGRAIDITKTPSDTDESSTPFSYTYQNQKGTLTFHEEESDSTVPFSCNEEENTITFCNLVLHKTT